MIRLLITGWVFMISVSFAVAQPGTDIWYFGEYAGLDFSNGNPQTLQNSSLNTGEGSAVMTDDNGNLLFYSDGITVWNAQHRAMPSGTGLWGHYSATQSVIIVPAPGNSSQYYLFTTTAQAGNSGGHGGLAYSTIDMTQDGGKGDIVLKNQPLLAPATEKLTAVLHCNGQDIWIIAHAWGNDQFHAYLLSDNGIASPVVSAAGSIHHGNDMATTGYLKASPNGKHLAAAKGGITDINVELFDFDNRTGTISDPKNLSVAGAAYGLSFSPKNRYLYVSISEFSDEKLIQFDLHTGGGHEDSIREGKTVIYESLYPLGALQAAPNGKIYVARPGKHRLGVIHHPDLAGTACTYDPNGITLEKGPVRFGLPSMLEQLYYDTLTVQFTYEPSGCSDNLIRFFEETSVLCDSNYNWSWDLGDGTTINQVSNPIHQYAQAGKYLVTLTVSANNKTQSSSKHVYVHSVRKPDFGYGVICVGSSTRFDPDIPCNPSTVSWDFGDGSPKSNSLNAKHLYQAAGNYAVTLEATWPDGYSDTVIKSVPVLAKQGNANFTYNAVCANYVEFKDLTPGEPVTWTWDFGDGSGISTDQDPLHFYQQPGVYTVQLVVSFNNSCGTDTISRQVLLQRNWELTYPREACLKVPVNFNSAIKGDPEKVEWVYINYGDGHETFFYQFPTTISHVYKQPGTFPLEAFILYDENRCSELITDSIRIFDRVKASFTLSDQSLCAGEYLDIKQTTKGQVSGWEWDIGNGSIADYNPSYRYDSAAAYTIRLIVTNDGGCKDSLSKNVLVNPKPDADFTTDKILCSGSSHQFKDLSGDVIIRYWDFGDGNHASEAAPEHVFKDPGTYKTVLTVENEYGCFDQAKQYLTVVPGIAASAGKDLFILKGQSAMLSASGGESYHWYPEGEMSDPGVPNPIVNPVETTAFVVEVTGTTGCKARDTVWVNVLDHPDIAVPKAFTPNGDGKNDLFYPVIKGDIELINFKVLNRWGELVFETHTKGIGWDGTYKGKEQPVETYIYQIITDSPNLHHAALNGSFTLLR